MVGQVVEGTVVVVFGAAVAYTAAMRAKRSTRRSISGVGGRGYNNFFCTPRPPKFVRARLGQLDRRAQAFHHGVFDCQAGL
mmetsp:Transcript_11709/g.29225  ORF Transcript_11709/g.29225 Transcript_11709/m.29225 type:complete len:81 (+) Transcript_11709:708-950(+)